MELVFTIDRADSVAVTAHLSACDSQFSPPLSERVNLSIYSRKLVDHATLFEAWSNDQLVGLVAGYIASSAERYSYLTNVSVLPEWRGQGVANNLISAYINYVRAAGIWRILLSVDSGSLGARSLYRKNGFVEISQQGDEIEMMLNLRAKT